MLLIYIININGLGISDRVIDIGTALLSRSMKLSTDVYWTKCLKSTSEDTLSERVITPNLHNLCKLPIENGIHYNSKTIYTRKTNNTTFPHNFNP